MRTRYPGRPWPGLLVILLILVTTASYASVAAASELTVEARLAQLEAQMAAAPSINSGDNAWLLASSALVLMMTAPGLILFYGGLVRQKMSWER
jgi:Amt family ammonium transporter